MQSVAMLPERAILMRLKIGTWQPYKFDRDVTDAIVGADVHAGRFNKHLLKNSIRFRNTNAAFVNVRLYHNQHSSPWLDDGFRMIKNEDYFTYVQEINALIETAKSAVIDLAAHWQEEIENDRKRFDEIAQKTGKPSMFCDDDYPKDIASHFYISLRPMPVPTIGDFRIDIGEEAKQQYNEMMEEAANIAATNAVNAMKEPMLALIKKLTEYQGERGQRWHESLVVNVWEATQVIRRINIMDDPNVNQFAKSLEELITPHKFNPHVLKEDEQAREAVKAKLNNLMNDMKAIFG